MTPKRRDILRNEQFRRYKTRRYRNPYFTRTEPRLWTWRTLFTRLGFLVAISLLVYLFGFATFWQINAVRIDGLEFMPSEEIETIAHTELARRRFLIFPASHRFLFPRERLERKLEENFAFASLDIRIDGKSLVINLKERISQVIWLSDGEMMFFVDVDGTIIRSIPLDDRALLAWYPSSQPYNNGQVLEGPYPRLAYLSSLPLIRCEDDEDLEPGATVLSPGSLTELIALTTVLREQGLAVRQFVVERTDSIWVKAEIVEGFDVLFDLSADPQSQLGYLTTVLEQIIDQRDLLDYVDVRFGDHVYYKLH